MFVDWKFIACVVSDYPVGIDIELIKIPNLKIEERFFARDEIDYINNGKQTQRFYEVWTKKESYIKYESKGLTITLPSFSVFDQSTKISFHRVFHNDESICHVCSSIQEEPSVRVIDTDTLFHMIVDDSF
ncbi:MAG: 4'-phosphopantetheinyl transferase superfamily protein, partial [Endomicrobium sp.]|nr:4'-phosphopantetheinyl transferase superfamily protein [Endomicrobium sp.]